MADDEYSQMPMNVFPYAFRQAALKFLGAYSNGDMLKLQVMDEGRKNGLIDLCSLLKEYGATYQNGVEYYEKLVSQMAPPAPPKLIIFDDGIRQFAERRVLSNPVVDEPQVPHKRMVVTFKTTRRWAAPAFD